MPPNPPDSNHASPQTEPQSPSENHDPRPAEASAYVRLTKLRALSGTSGDEQGGVLTGATSEGSPGHYIDEGYVIDGWFLETPCVGRIMVLLRFRRNTVYRFGVFTSSLVTFVGETEIHTVNSVYRIERHPYN